MRKQRFILFLLFLHWIIRFPSSSFHISLLLSSPLLSSPKSFHISFFFTIRADILQHKFHIDLITPLLYYHSLLSFTISLQSFTTALSLINHMLHWFQNITSYRTTDAVAVSADYRLRHYGFIILDRHAITVDTAPSVLRICGQPCSSHSCKGMAGRGRQRSAPFWCTCRTPGLAQLRTQHPLCLLHLKACKRERERRRERERYTDR